MEGARSVVTSQLCIEGLAKWPKIPQMVPPSESPKVMGLMAIHNLDTLCHCNGMTHCPWCGKEGQNEGTVINHLWTVHYKLGLVCSKCYNYPSASSDTLCCQSQQNCQPSGEEAQTSQLHPSNHQQEA